MTKPFIAANWKMNRIPGGALELQSPYMSGDKVDVVVFPTSLDLQTCLQAGITVGGQYGHSKNHGAHTGDISMSMLKEAGCSYVLCGHSERRKAHQESDDDIAAQTQAALAVGLHPIVCIGETAEQRKAGKEKEIIQHQLNKILNPIPHAPLADHSLGEGWYPVPLTIAYEPVWAIGTGNTATPEQAQEMHAFIRSSFPSPLSSVRILYGGSMNPDNAKELLSQKDIDGGLIGGASLDRESFRKIVEIAGRNS